MPKFTTPANSGAGARQFKDLRRNNNDAEIYNPGPGMAGGRVKFLFKFVFKS